MYLKTFVESIFQAKLKHSI